MPGLNDRRPTRRTASPLDGGELSLSAPSALDIQGNCLRARSVPAGFRNEAGTRDGAPRPHRSGPPRYRLRHTGQPPPPVWPAPALVGSPRSRPGPPTSRARGYVVAPGGTEVGGRRRSAG